jgi:hypothetical protein
MWFCRVALLTTYELRRQAIMLSGNTGMTAFEFLGPTDVLRPCTGGRLVMTGGLPSAIIDEDVLVRSRAGHCSGSVREVVGVSVSIEVLENMLSRLADFKLSSAPFLQLDLADFASVPSSEVLLSSEESLWFLTWLDRY